MCVLSHLFFKKAKCPPRAWRPFSPQHPIFGWASRSSEYLEVEDWLGFEWVYFWKGPEEHDTNLLCFNLHGNVDLTVVFDLEVLLDYWNWTGWLVFALSVLARCLTCWEHLLWLAKKCKRLYMACFRVECSNVQEIHSIMHNSPLFHICWEMCYLTKYLQLYTRQTLYWMWNYSLVTESCLLEVKYWIVKICNYLLCQFPAMVLNYVLLSLV